MRMPIADQALGAVATPPGSMDCLAMRYAAALERYAGRDVATALLGEAGHVDMWTAALADQESAGFAWQVLLSPYVDGAQNPFWQEEECRHLDPHAGQSPALSGLFGSRFTVPSQSILMVLSKW